MELQVRYFYTSHPGRVRRSNQDNFLLPGGKYLPGENRGTNGILQGSSALSQAPVFAVFDGMGGEAFGEVAAEIAASTLSETDLSGDPVAALRQMCFTANQRICHRTEELGVAAMGTTAAILHLTENAASLCNIGDSKIFALSGGRFVQLSYDHLAVAPFGHKAPLSQSLGIPPEELIIDPFVAQGSFFAGDMFLLCSDGLTDMVAPERIGQILLTQSPENAAGMLLQEALQNGGKDNITFILLLVTE